MGSSIVDVLERKWHTLRPKLLFYFQRDLFYSLLEKEGLLTKNCTIVPLHQKKPSTPPPNYSKHSPDPLIPLSPQTPYMFHISVMKFNRSKINFNKLTASCLVDF